MAATDFDYIATRNEIIEGAMRIVGALEAGQTLSSDLLDQGVKALQLLVKHWSNKHLFLWSFDQGSVSTIASQAYVDSTLDQSIIGLDKAWVVDSNDDIPLQVISYSEYLDIVDKTTNTGRPTAIAYKPTPSPSFYFWPEPDAIYTIHTLCVYPLQDFDTAAGTGDLPVKFQKALKYGLAEDLYDEYPGPMNRMQFIQQKALMLFQEAKNADKPVVTNNEVQSLFGRGRV